MARCPLMELVGERIKMDEVRMTHVSAVVEDHDRVIVEAVVGLEVAGIQGSGLNRNRRRLFDVVGDVEELIVSEAVWV